MKATIVQAAQPCRAKLVKASTTTDQDEDSDSDYGPFSHELKPASFYNQRKTVPKRRAALDRILRRNLTQRKYDLDRAF